MKPHASIPILAALLTLLAAQPVAAQYGKTAAERRKAIEAELKRLQTQISDARNWISEIESQVKPVVAERDRLAMVRDAEKEKLAELRRELSEARSQFTAAEVRLRREIANDPQLAEDRTQLEAMTDELQRRREDRMAVIRKLAAYQSLETRVAEAKQRMESAGEEDRAAAYQAVSEAARALDAFVEERLVEDPELADAMAEHEQFKSQIESREDEMRASIQQQIEPEKSALDDATERAEAQARVSAEAESAYRDINAKLRKARPIYDQAAANLSRLEARERALKNAL